MEKFVFITRRERFNAAHRLFKPEWTDAENTAVFGGCANPNWHGHNYELFITIKGTVNPETGFVMDLKALRDIVNERVIDKIDHKNINLDVDFMAGKMSSTEVLAVEIWNQLADAIALTGAFLHCVKLYETENNFAEYYG
jgi:6-pyruvoyltetrahydropterin/6-carboxytetrahydropterin synthase